MCTPTYVIIGLGEILTIMIAISYHLRYTLIL